MKSVEKTIEKYGIIQKGDKIGVACSGGKDSMSLLHYLHSIAKEKGFEVVAITVDHDLRDTSADDAEFVVNYCEKLGIKVYKYKVNVSKLVNEKGVTVETAARDCRYRVFKALLAKGAVNKIALGHHYDDVIETILMGMLYSGQIQTMMPKLHSKNFEGMELIRPLYLIREKDILHWRDYNALNFLQCACRFTEEVESGESQHTSKRAETKELIKFLKEKDECIEGNIFKSVENVCLDTIIAYKDKRGKHHFLDTYDEE